jgi:hypothetical protein
MGLRLAETWHWDERCGARRPEQPRHVETIHASYIRAGYLYGLTR